MCGTITAYLAPCSLCGKRAVSLEKSGYELPDMFIQLDGDTAILVHKECMTSATAWNGNPGA
jgi:hypothetical protein